MRTLVVLTVFFCGLVFIQPATKPVIAQEKKVPVKWEYAELVYQSFAIRSTGKDGDRGGNTMTIRWTSKAGEFSVKDWDELAEKLKFPFKKDSTASSQKNQILNGLGAEGWELVSNQVGPTLSTTLTFKRQVP